MRSLALVKEISGAVAVILFATLCLWAFITAAFTI